MRYTEREEDDALLLETTGMKEHAKEDVSRYRRKVNAHVRDGLVGGLV